jgi:hypothetical protein
MPAMTIGQCEKVPDKNDTMVETAIAAATIQVMPDILLVLLIGDEPPQTTKCANRYTTWMDLLDSGRSDMRGFTRSHA